MSMALLAVLSVLNPPANSIELVRVNGPPVAGCLMIKVKLCPVTGLANALSVMLPVRVRVCTFPLAAFGVIVPVVVPPVNTTSRESVAVNVVNTPVDAVLDPIAPGLANVAPLMLLAFKLATLVVDDTVNGAVPVACVLVNVVADNTPAPLKVAMLAVPAYHLNCCVLVGTLNHCVLPSIPMA